MSSMASPVSPSPMSTSGVSDLFRHRSSSVALPKKLCRDLDFSGSFLDFALFLAFSGEDLGVEVIAVLVEASFAFGFFAGETV